VLAPTTARATASAWAVLLPAQAGRNPPERGAHADLDAHRAGVGAAQLRRQEGHGRARVQQLANWKPNATRVDEIPFVVARVVLQDFTGVPLLADLAAMRNVAARMGKDPKAIEPLVPVDLVVDHSVMIDHYGTKKALDLNMKLEFERNRERYEFMKWGMQAFDTFGVVPPGFGIVHQVNLEYLARGVHRARTAFTTPTRWWAPTATRP
jgi:aconitase A